METLAIDGGNPVRKNPFPFRGLLGLEEKEALNNLIDESLRDGIPVGYNGKWEQQYEKEFADFMGGGYADAVNSGTNAVFCALGGLELEPFSEVIVPPVTDPGGVMPVVFVGCIPVFADSDPETYNISAEGISKAVTPRTKAVIVAHISGDPADMDSILDVAEKNDLYVIEDCAQAHGALYKGKLAGTMGHYGVFSTMFGKHHSTGGQGGVVYSRDEALHMRARRFADRGKPFGIDSPGNVTAGLNCNLSDLSAVLGSTQLAKLPEFLKRRRQFAEMIYSGIEELASISRPTSLPDTESAYWFLKFRINFDNIKVDKKQFCDAVTAEGIPIMPDYRHIQCETPWFKNKKVFGKGGFPWNNPEYKGDREPVFELPNIETMCGTHFNLSIHERWGREEADSILNAFKKVDNAYIK